MATIVGLAMTYTVYQSTLAAERSRFEVVADEAADRIDQRFRQHIALLLATRSLFVATGGYPPRTTFRNYVNGLELNGRFRGVQGLGFARMIKAQDTEIIEAAISRDYDINVSVRPETAQTVRTPIVLLEPFDRRNHQAIGYDMFAESSRREAMLKATETNTPQATAPVELVQEITSDKQAGFLVYLPLIDTTGTERDDGDSYSKVVGFVYAPFRAGDLHTSALDRSPKPAVVVETRDTTDGRDGFLYRSPDFHEVAENSLYMIEKQLDVAGRSWTIAIHERSTFRGQVSFLSVFLLGAVSLFFAAALAVSTRSRIKAFETAQNLNRISRKVVAEKDLMLQEMKHRIKNYLARVSAIARQTAAGSESLDAFNKSFAARIQSMANAQDLLTRSEWKKCNLRDLLENELTQVFGGAFGPDQLDGPDIELNENLVQALGLTFHELSTNAMKYGAFANDGGKLSVRWEVSGQRHNRTLIIDWAETFPDGASQPDRVGFGIRLIDANVKGELGGKITRRYDSNGMYLRISVPL